MKSVQSKKKTRKTKPRTVEAPQPEPRDLILAETHRREAERATHDTAAYWALLAIGGGEYAGDDAVLSMIDSLTRDLRTLVLAIQAEDPDGPAVDLALDQFESRLLAIRAVHLAQPKPAGAK